MRSFAILAIPLMMMVGACTTTDSSLVDTDDLYPDFSVEATGGGTSDVYAILHVHSPTSAETADVGNGDALSCTTSAGGVEITTKELNETVAFGIASYHNTFDGESGGMEFTIDFDRSGSGNESAPNSTVTLPTTLEIEKVTRVEDGPAITEFSRSTEDIYVDWAPWDELDDMMYEIDGTCINQQVSGITGGDTGRLHIPAGSIIPLGGQETASCPVTIRIIRSRTGSVDPAFGGGNVKAMQIRSATVNSLE